MWHSRLGCGSKTLPLIPRQHFRPQPRARTNSPSTRHVVAMSAILTRSPLRFLRVSKVLGFPITAMLLAPPDVLHILALAIPSACPPLRFRTSIESKLRQSLVPE